jgi:hypothetical protein
MFSTAKCGHCGKTGTKLQVIEPNGAKYKQTAVCCQWCNAILSVGGFYDTSAQIKALEDEQKKLKALIQQIDHNVQQIGRALQGR